MAGKVKRGIIRTIRNNLKSNVEPDRILCDDELEEMPAVENRILEILRKYFDQRDDIAFAFLFGSSAQGRIRREGDVDVAVYFWPEEGLEWESVKKRYPGESRIALDLEKLLRKEIDLIVLNRAKAVLADEAIRKGKPIVVKDRELFLEFLCVISDEAEQMRDWIETSYRERQLEASR